MIEHLVTSGCSFSDNFGTGRWPHFLANALSCKLYNRGQGSAGNQWISSSAIYQTQLLLDRNIDPSNILVAVMWSGISRKDLFIDKATPNFEKLINFPYKQENPLNFINTEPNLKTYDNFTNTESGYLFGSPVCEYTNNKINKFKKELILKYFSNQSLAIESYENFLKLQWFCKANNIKLINQTFQEIFNFPYVSGKLTKDVYKNVEHLYKMIDFNSWIFWNGTNGLFEYTKDNGLAFDSDGTHPNSASHKYYVDNYLIKELHKKNIL